MNDHPEYAYVKTYCERHPAQAGALWQTFIDLKLSQRWDDVKVEELTNEAGCIVSGVRPTQKDLGRQIVYPIHLNSQTSMNEMHSLFDVLPESAKSILLAISANDSSIVYYKISKGIVPPKEVKD